MSPLRFRAMTPDDLEDVVQIERACFSSPWERRGFAQRLARRSSACYVATDGEAIVLTKGRPALLIKDGIYEPSDILEIKRRMNLWVAKAHCLA